MSHRLIALRRGPLACTVAAAALLSAAALAEVPARAPGGVLQLAGCAREAGEYRGTLEDTLVLDQLFLDAARPEEPQVQEAIGQQLKYLWGYYRNDPAAHATAQLVLSAEAPQVTLLRRREGLYGRELEIAWGETGQHLKLEQAYQVQAARRGAAHAGDPALIIDYRIVFKLALCGAPRAARSTLPTLLPRDPWLMHWHVAQSQHRRLCYHGDECAVTSPCNDDDYADLPHPFYHWYDWSPARHGADADGRPFDCRQLLHPGLDTFEREVQLTRLGGGGSDFTQLRDSLAAQETVRATVLIGVLDHAWKDLAFDKLAAAFAGAGSGAGSLARAGELLQAPDGREHGTARFLRLLSGLRGLLRPGKVAVSVEGAYLKATVEGTLLRSDKPVRIHAYVGLTDIFGPTPPTHWPILRRALLEDQVIVYAGHSGIGENFRLAQIEERTGSDPAAFRAALLQAPSQLIAYLSCYSYMYFGEDLVAASGAAGAGREFIYTGTEFSQGDKGALAVLDFVDQILAGAAAPRFRFVDPADFLLVKRVDGGGTSLR